VDLGSIYHENHAALAVCGTGETLFGQLTERGGIPFLAADADDGSGAPIGGGTFVPLGRAHTRRSNAALLAAGHPHPSQGREQTQFGLIEHIHIGPTRRVP
jgi:hypothetical protein